jgi:hypothetical protein
VKRPPKKTRRDKQSELAQQIRTELRENFNDAIKRVPNMTGTGDEIKTCWNIDDRTTAHIELNSKPDSEFHFIPSGNPFDLDKTKALFEPPNPSINTCPKPTIEQSDDAKAFLDRRHLTAQTPRPICSIDDIGEIYREERREAVADQHNHGIHDVCNIIDETMPPRVRVLSYEEIASTMMFPTELARGKNFKSELIIIDEAQNFVFPSPATELDDHFSGADGSSLTLAEILERAGTTIRDIPIQPAYDDLKHTLRSPANPFVDIPSQSYAKRFGDIFDDAPGTAKISRIRNLIENSKLADTSRTQDSELPLMGTNRFGSNHAYIGQMVRAIVSPTAFCYCVGIVQVIDESHPSGRTLDGHEITLSMAQIAFPTINGEGIETHWISTSIIAAATSKEIAAMLLSARRR